MKKMIMFFLATILILFIGFKMAMVIEKRITFNNSIKSEINQEKLFSINQIKQINVDANDTGVRVNLSDTPNVKIDFKGYVITKNKQDVPILITKNENGKLDVQVKKVTNRQVHYQNGTLLNIIIPKSYLANMSLSTNYGDIDVKNLNINELRLKSNTGNINCSEVTAKNIVGITSYGKIYFNDFVGNTDIISNRGDVFLQYKKLNYNAKIETSSAKVKVILPEDSGVHLKAKTISGRIENGFFSNTGNFIKKQLDESTGNVKNEVEVNTASGDIIITK